MNPLLTKTQLAELLECSKRHIDNLVRRRAIPIVRTSKRFVRFNLENVLAALQRFESQAVDAQAATSRIRREHKA
ncbi:MAG TPA: hypothetical protein PLU30_15125 [Verrucomicrobiae bacterium]|nr:hypothetical protein [Verrucomicrobiae bacterium]